MMQTIHSCEVRRKVVNIMSSEERPKLPVNSLVGALNLIEAILNEMMDEYAAAVAKLQKRPHDRVAENTIDEVENWVCTETFVSLTGGLIDPEDMLDMMRKAVENGQYKRRNNHAGPKPDEQELAKRAHRRALHQQKMENPDYAASMREKTHTWYMNRKARGKR